MLSAAKTVNIRIANEILPMDLRSFVGIQFAEKVSFKELD
jgi:hypothetical protein